jgi:phosphate transport system protein
MTTRTIFENELIQLRDDLKRMCFMVEAVYEKLFSAMQLGDRSTIIDISEQDHQVRDMEKQIESRCLSLITKQQPMARDLRMVSASLKVVTDIKRVGDHVVDIAELLLRMNIKDFAAYSGHLDEMVRETKEMFHDSVGAFLKRSKDEAEQVIEKDDVIDELFNTVKRDLIEHLKKDTANADDCIDILMIAKYLEKIGDHAVNVGEWEIFQETGDIRNTRIL